MYNYAFIPIAQAYTYNIRSKSIQIYFLHSITSNSKIPSNFVACNYETRFLQNSKLSRFTAVAGKTKSAKSATRNKVLRRNWIVFVPKTSVL